MKEKMLIDQLMELKDSDIYPFHMPGHKRQLECHMNPYAIDITEIEDFDNLHHANGVLERLQKAWAKQCQSDEAYLLVNGSSGGILSSIYASTKENDHILISRNSHKSVYHAACLRHLKVSYLYPEILEEGINSAINPKQVEEALEKNKEIKLVVITSPTYDGIVSDIDAISSIVHKHQAILIVDCAHGAHFGLHEGFPKRTAMQKADFCIISLHKTLPSPTQSALLLKNGTRVEREMIKEALGIFETSSPSYVMMAAMERCLRLCEESVENKERLNRYVQMLDQFYLETKELKNLEVYSHKDKDFHDRTKILILTNKVNGYSGEDLKKELRSNYHIECEMAAVNYVIALSSFMDTAEGMRRLSNALKSIDARLISSKGIKDRWMPEDFLLKTRLYDQREKVYDMYEASQIATEVVPIKESSGRICAEFVYLYPPGIPIIAKGEKIPKYFAEEIERIKKLNLELNGLADDHANTIKVLKIG